VCAGHRRGYKNIVGRVGERRGRETRRRARVRTRWSTAGARKAELTRQVHNAERVKGTRGGNGSALVNRAHETKREGARGRRKPASTDRPHWVVSERKRARARDWRRQAGSACQGWQACAGLGLVGWFGPKWPFLFPWIF
jgi:hypothetical protein